MKATRIAAIAAVALGLAVAPAAAAQADTPDPVTPYSQHVTDCAQTMMLDGVDNPGMHDGMAGWDGM